MPIQNLFTTTQLAHQIETIGLGILGPGRLRPRPPRILRTLEVVYRISSVSRGLAPFPLGFPTFPLTRNVVLNDKPI